MLPLILKSVLSWLCLGIAYFFDLIGIPIAFLLKKQGYKLFPLHWDFGHLGLEPHALVMLLELQGKMSKKVIFSLPRGTILARKPLKANTSNPYLLKLWSHHFCVIQSTFLCWLFRPILYPYLYQKSLLLADFPRIHYPLDAWVHPTYTRYHSRSYNTKPPLTLPKEALSKGYDILSEHFGISSSDWFVTINARNSAHYQANFAEEEKTWRFRNVDVSTYQLAIEEITARGGWVIRVGSPKSEPLPPSLQRIPHVIDYARSSACSPDMDIFLLAKNSFFLGCNSGISFIPPIFGGSCLQANIAPICCGYPFYHKTLVLLKRFYSSEEQRFATFKEMLFRDYSRQEDYFHHFFMKGYRLCDNSSKEIHACVLQMLDEQEGIDTMTSEYARLIKQFRKHVSPMPMSRSLARPGFDFLVNCEQDGMLKTVNHPVENIYSLH